MEASQARLRALSRHADSRLRERAFDLHNIPLALSPYRRLRRPLGIPRSVFAAPAGSLMRPTQHPPLIGPRQGASTTTGRPRLTLRSPISPQRDSDYPASVGAAPQGAAGCMANTARRGSDDENGQAKNGREGSQGASKGQTTATGAEMDSGVPRADTEEARASTGGLPRSQGLVLRTPVSIHSGAASDHSEQAAHQAAKERREKEKVFCEAGARVGVGTTLRDA
jgi:hypothetical protein